MGGRPPSEPWGQRLLYQLTQPPKAPDALTPRESEV